MRGRVTAPVFILGGRGHVDRLRGLADLAGYQLGTFDHFPRVIAMRRYLFGFVALFLSLLPLSALAYVQFPDQGAAYAACVADSQQAAIDAKAAYPGWDYKADQCVYQSAAGVSSNYQPYYRCQAERIGSGGTMYACKKGTERYYAFPAQNSCSTRADSSGTFAGDVGACINGCQFAPDISGGGVTRYEVGGTVFTRADVLAPTGSTCTSSPSDVAPDSDACVQQGSLTQCVKPDGRTCTRSSTGKLFCYDTSESGSKYSGNEATVITPEGVAPKPPSTPPANGGEWIKAGEGTITVTKDGVTTTRTVTTYVSSYGPQGKNDGAEGEEKEGDKGPTASTGLGCDQSSFMCSDMSTVECNQLIQTWYLRCKGKQINGGANCESPPVCEGNSVDCFVTHQLWQYRCEGKVEVDSDGTSRNAFDAQSESDGDGTDEPDAAHMPGNGDTADMGIWEERTVGGAEDLAKLNASGFLGGSGSCPQLPSVSVGGRGSLSFNLNPICDLLRNVGIMVMALAYWLAYRIIAKARK